MSSKWLNNLALTAAVSALVLCSPAFGQTKSAGAGANLTSAERIFLENMARGNMAEVELGNLAQQKSSNQTVKDFGQRMVTDHTKLNDDLKQFAESRNITLPTKVSSAEASQKQKLEQLSGNSFDKAYMTDMLSDHQHDVMEVQRMAEHAQDPGVKQLAAKILPIFEDHLQIAENDAAQFGIKPTKGLNQPEHPTSH